MVLCNFRIVQITVRIQGLDYDGIVIQVRANDTMSETPLGTFSDFAMNTMSLNCTADNDSVTHSSTTPKNNETVYTWNAPSDLMVTIIVV